MEDIKVWIITDTHFYDDKLREYEDRPSNFNEIIITNWNLFVRDPDVVIHLGDVIVGHQLEMESIIRSLKGQKILVRGNHDHESPGYYLERGFCFVCDIFSIDDVVFSHRPLDVFPDGCRFNVHGHFHRRGHRNDECREFFEGRDMSAYRLVHIEDDLSPILLSDLIADIHRTKN